MGPGEAVIKVAKLGLIAPRVSAEEEFENARVEIVNGESHLLGGIELGQSLDPWKAGCDLRGRLCQQLECFGMVDDALVVVEKPGQIARGRKSGRARDSQRTTA